MTRSLGTLTYNALDSDHVEPIYFVELGPFDSVSPEITERFHSRLGTINTLGHDWIGTGELMTFQSAKEVSGLSPQALRIGLNAADASILNVIFNTNYYGRSCKVYIGAMSGGSLVETPTLLFRGAIMNIDVALGDNQDSIELTAESELIFFKRSRNVRFTDAQLQSEYSGDLGLQYLDIVAQQKVVWRGKANPLGSGGSRGGGGGFPGFDPGRIDIRFP